MGRYINCKIGNDYEIVWKYGLGVQASEMNRISIELGIGEYHLIRYMDEESQEKMKKALGMSMYQKIRQI